MHKKEAIWISNIFSSMSTGDISPLLNIGSSTQEYRTIHQPFIDELIFSPLHDLNIKVVHQDIKDAPGVDVVGDLLDPDFLTTLKGSSYKAVICSNLLEHVIEREMICSAISDVVVKGGYIIVTVPKDYPQHMDPIDTMYRPSPLEISNLFPSVKVIDEQVISVGTVWESMSSHPLKLFKLLFRVCIPFYKHSGWVTAANKLYWMWKERRISCVVLQKLS